MLCEEIFNNLSEIIENSGNKDNVYTIFFFAKKAIQNKEIMMVEQPDINSEINHKMKTSIFGIFFGKTIQALYVFHSAKNTLTHTRKQALRIM